MSCQRGLRWWLALAWLATMLLGAAPCRAGPGAPAQAPPAAITVQQALFQRGDAGTGAAWQPVALPDTWAARGLPLAGSGRYRLTVQLAAAPQGVWALAVGRLSSDATVHVNGVLLARRGAADGAGASHAAKPMPLLLELPAGLLAAGENRIDIAWRLSMRAGMSAVTLGPSDALREDADLHQLLDQTTPQLLNAAGAALAVFMLLIWWRRRREHTFGLFGLLWLLVSARNLAFFGRSSTLPADLTIWLAFVAQVGSTALLGAFAVAVSGRRWPRFERLLWWVAGALPLLGLAAALAGQLPALRSVAYPGLMGLALAALWVLFGAVRQARRRTLAAVLLGLAVVVAAGVHDYLFLQGLLPVTHMFWLPYAVPLGCMWFALVLVQRTVVALNATEELAARLEARVAERTRALDEANQAQGRFLAAASHDLRQPVVAIGLLLGLARERTQAPEMRQLLDRTQAATRALEDLLRGLLDLSRLENHTTAPQQQPLALQGLFDAIAAHEQPAATAAGLRLRLRPSALQVRSDPVLLEQVLRNLVGNALRHTRRGGVLVVARRRAGQVLLQVWDTGRGIPAADQQRVFEPFVQLHNPERDRSKGQGLGLAIVRRSVDLLGHPLALRSVPGRGSCFSISLPEAAAAPATAGPAPVPDQPLAGQAIWLLDDDPAVRDAMVGRLAAWGAQVHPHASLAALRASLDAGLPAPAWLLTDHRLPDGDGAQAIALLRARLGPVPALLVTGDTAPALLAGFAAQQLPVLHKPFRQEALLQRLLAPGSGASGG